MEFSHESKPRENMTQNARSWSLSPARELLSSSIAAFSRSDPFRFPTPEKSSTATGIFHDFGRGCDFTFVRGDSQIELMDSESTVDGYFHDLIKEPSLELDPSSKTLPSRAASNACFDCNICLEFATDPVVTLCGHLYCWPCIFRWLHLEASPRHCPVCKSSLSESSLVPLYGRGLSSKPHSHGGIAVPDRPRDHRACASSTISPGNHHPPLSPTESHQMHQNYQLYNTDRVNHTGILHSSPAGTVLGEMALSMLPLAFRDHQDLYADLSQSPSSRRGRSQRWRQDARAESWLHQLWLFLVCCAFLCLLFF